MAKKIALAFMVFCLSLGFMNNAGAELLTYSGGGEITSIDAENSFGLNIGDSVSWSVSYDPAWIEVIPYGDWGIWVGNHDDEGAALTIEIGSYTFTEDQDLEYPNFPRIYTEDELPYGFDFIADLGDDFYFCAYLGEFFFTSPYAVQLGSPHIHVQGVFNGFPSTAVPVPAAAWLLGSGLLGLAGLRRKFAK